MFSIEGIEFGGKSIVFFSQYINTFVTMKVVTSGSALFLLEILGNFLQVIVLHCVGKNFFICFLLLFLFYNLC